MTSIQGIYIALYGRPADPAGLAYYTDVTNNGEDLSSIGDLSSVPEYQDRFADMSATEIVTSIYESLFERAPDAEGLAFYVSLLEESSANINRIAIDILNGAQSPDIETINAKIEAADLFTMHLDTDAEVAAYQGNDAAAVGRAFIDTVNADDEGTGDEADTYILMLFPDEGQAPGEEPSSGGGGGGGGSGSGGSSGPSFGVSVTADGTLEFTGSASGDVSVEEIGGVLVFHREGKTSALSSDATISRFEDGVTIRSLGESQVLAIDETGKWDFKSFPIGDLQLDAIDFYYAIKGSANVLMLSEFSLDASWEQLTAITEFFNSGVLPSWFSEIDDIEELADIVAGLVATSENLTVAAADGAQSSLNPLLEFLIGAIGGEGIDLPNIGLPILLNGDADALSANGSEGFTLVGNYQVASNDTLTGGDGDDVLLGLHDAGSADFTVDLYAGSGATLDFQTFNYSDINEVGEFVLGTGYQGNGVGFTAISEELPGGDNIMRISSDSDQTVTIFKYGDADSAIEIVIAKGDVAFVNVGEGGTYKLSHSGGEATMSTDNGDNDLIERDIDADLITFGDVLTGGEGADIFVYLYENGVDVIADFDRGVDSLLLQVGNFDIFNSVDLDGVGDADDSFIAFYDLETGEYMLNAGVAVLGTADFTPGDLFGSTPV